MPAYEVFAEFYDRLTENVEYVRRAEYFDSIIRDNIDSAKLLLDLACGTGSLSYELAARGYDVIGADASVDMLSIAVQKRCEDSAEEQCNPMFIEQDMTEMQMDTQMDVVVCALDSLNHITELSQLEKVFKCVGNSLRQGGLFVFDVNTIYKHREVLGNNIFVYDLGDLCCYWENAIDEELSDDDSLLVDIWLDFYIAVEFNEDNPEGLYYRRCESFSERAYGANTLARLLSQNGFEILHIYNDCTRDPIDETTERAVYVVRKSGGAD